MKEKGNAAGEDRRDTLKKNAVSENSSYYTLKVSRKWLIWLAGTLLLFILIFSSFAAGYYTNELKGKFVERSFTKNQTADWDIPETKNSQPEEDIFPDFSEIEPKESLAKREVLRGTVKSFNSDSIVLSTFKGEFSIDLDENTVVNNPLKSSSLEDLVEGTQVLVIAEKQGENRYLARRIIIVPQEIPQESL